LPILTVSLLCHFAVRQRGKVHFELLQKLKIFTKSYANAFLDEGYRQEYRTLYYAFHWRDAYIEEFGEDSYMREAERFISSLFSDNDIKTIDNYFLR
jgi:hypothetical protein